jgi:hypothetical protein
MPKKKRNQVCSKEACSECRNRGNERVNHHVEEIAMEWDLQGLSPDSPHPLSTKKPISERSAWH